MLRGYEVSQRRAERNGTRLHTSAKTGAAAKNIEKLTEKASWYKEEMQEEQRSGVEDSPSERRRFIPQKVSRMSLPAGSRTD